MKHLVVFLLVALLGLSLCACQSSSEAALNDSVQEQPTDAFDESKWTEFSDYELLERTIKSSTMTFRQLSAVWMTAEEWKEYMLSYCEPFQALMLRDTAKESLEAYSLMVIHAYEGDSASVRAENFALLVMTVFPELQEQFQDIVISHPPRMGTEETVTIDISK